MKTLSISLLGLLLAIAGSTALASGTQLSSRSAGKLALEQGIDLSERVKQAEPVVRAESEAAENYDASSAARRFAGVANRHDQLFEIYDADVRLVADMDGDGYHHGINVYIDVDVNYDVADVYAKLYLSREGEPWSQYFATDLFHIDGDDVADAYEIETELLEGYDPGYYAVLVEIYSLDHAYMVTSEVLDYHYLGKDLTIEDRYWDEPQAITHGEIYVSGAGGMEALLLFFLLVQVVIAARGALAKTPLTKCEKYNNKRFP